MWFVRRVSFTSLWIRQWMTEQSFITKNNMMWKFIIAYIYIIFILLRKMSLW